MHAISGEHTVVLVAAATLWWYKGILPVGKCRTLEIKARHLNFSPPIDANIIIDFMWHNYCLFYYLRWSAMFLKFYNKVNVLCEHVETEKLFHCKKNNRAFQISVHNNSLYGSRSIQTSNGQMYIHQTCATCTYMLMFTYAWNPFSAVMLV